MATECDPARRDRGSCEVEMRWCQGTAVRSYIAKSIAKHFCSLGCRIERRKVRCESGAGDVHVKPEGVVGVALTAKGARHDTKPRDDGDDIKEPIA